MQDDEFEVLTLDELIWNYARLTNTRFELTESRHYNLTDAERAKLRRLNEDINIIQMMIAGQVMMDHGYRPVITDGHRRWYKDGNDGTIEYVDHTGCYKYRKYEEG